jgi:hypothetical protein
MEFAFDTSTFEATILNGQTGMTAGFDKMEIHYLTVAPNPFVTI